MAPFGWGWGWGGWGGPAGAREVLSYLRKARYNPELRFEGGIVT